MFVLRLGSSCSVQITENMPPHKKLKVTDTGSEDGRSQSRTANDADPDISDFGADWREKCESVCSKNYYALRKNILSDVTFIVGQSSTVCHGHRLILALGSPVFEAMFYGALAEKGDTITIPDVDPEGFQNLLRFLYSDDIVFKNDVIAFKTYFAADKYCVTSLKERCEKYLCRCELTPSSVWIFLESSVFLNSQAIKERCFSLLGREIQSALEHSSFLDVNVKTVESVLAMDNLNISEVNLLTNVVRWAEHKSRLEQADSFENILKPLLPYARFGAFTAPEFVTLRRHRNLKEVLSEQDALTILEHIICPTICALPDWCCSKKQRCYESIPAKQVPAFCYKDKKLPYKRKQYLKNCDVLEVSDSSSSSSSSSSSESINISSSDSDLSS